MQRSTLTQLRLSCSPELQARRQAYRALSRKAGEKSLSYSPIARISQITELATGYPLFCPAVGQDTIREQLERMIKHDRQENQTQVGPSAEDQDRQWNPHREGLLHGAEVAGNGVFAIEPRQTNCQIDQG